MMERAPSRSLVVVMWEIPFLYMIYAMSVKTSRA